MNFKTAYIYKLYCETPNGIDNFYVGRSKNPQRRKYEYFGEFRLRYETKLNEYLTKKYKMTNILFKSSVKMKIIEVVKFVGTVQSSAVVRLRQTHWINKLGTLQKGNKVLPNEYKSLEETNKAQNKMKTYCSICDRIYTTKNIKRHNQSKKHILNQKKFKK